MKKSFILSLMLLSLVACTKGGGSANSGSVDYCKYAEAKPDRGFLYGGQGIAGCEVVKSESKKADMMGQKVVGHRVELKLKIEQLEDDCDSQQGQDCNVRLKEKSCIKENGKAVSFCKYPDAKVITKKGTFIKEMKRGLELLEEDGGQHKVQITANKELK